VVANDKSSSNVSSGRTADTNPSCIIVLLPYRY
jgi:hypothetical protein